MRDTLLGGGGLLVLLAMIARVRDSRRTPDHQRKVANRSAKVEALKQERAEKRAARS